jgi:hypothetical protein
LHVLLLCMLHIRPITPPAHYFIGLYDLPGPPVWSSGQSFWLHIQRSRVRFSALPDLLRSSGLQRGPLSFLNTIEELLGRKSSVSGLGSRDYVCRGSTMLTVLGYYELKKHKPWFDEECSELLDN